MFEIIVMGAYFLFLLILWLVGSHIARKEGGLLGNMEAAFIFYVYGALGGVVTVVILAIYQLYKVLF